MPAFLELPAVLLSAQPFWNRSRLLFCVWVAESGFGFKTQLVPSLRSSEGTRHACAGADERLCNLGGNLSRDFIRDAMNNGLLFSVRNDGSEL